MSAIFAISFSTKFYLCVGVGVMTTERVIDFFVGNVVHGIAAAKEGCRCLYTCKRKTRGYLYKRLFELIFLSL